MEVLDNHEVEADSKDDIQEEDELADHGKVGLFFHVEEQNDFDRGAMGVP